MLPLDQKRLQSTLPVIVRDGGSGKELGKQYAAKEGGNGWVRKRKEAVAKRNERGIERVALKYIQYHS